MTSPAIASKVDPATGTCLDENCKGAHKVELFARAYPGVQIDEFYSDSLSDTPLAEISKKAFLVQGDKIEAV